MAQTLILILGDQLTPGLSSLRGARPDKAVVLMAEVAGEAGYVRHHKKKIAFLFSAMRHFAEELCADGWTVDYVRLDDADNSGSLAGEVMRAAERQGATHVRVTEPGEWRLLQDLQVLDTVIDLEILPDDRFIASHAEFESWAEGRKALRMEYFYREMRRKTGLLMDGDAPAGGKWNFDQDNRKAAARDLLMPQPLRFAPDAITRDVLDLVGVQFDDHFGTLEPFWFATTRADAKAAFAHVLKTALPRFGDYQDAMLAGEKFLYHAVVSLYLNCGLLDPLEMCRAVEAEYRAGRAPLNAAEGFIRQIIGWREYVRGIYWREGPDYVRRNALQATRRLPAFYWSADTEMACVKACVEQTRDEAYAHHIQRLMVTGNFALLAGIDPHELHEWYLAVYADAYEWVEAPNTVGMSQFADGGLLASKPYVASGAYIDRMSDYCRGCAYDVKAKAGPKACPFNYLYWDFISRHHDRLKGNPRMAQMVRTYDRFSDVRKAEIETDSSRFLLSMETRNQEPL
ncbi:MAG: cryptochrome/photolyase family protein [Sphingomonadales bacterium]|nr:cryptochrome/photolyase family protein [Sphingomonadales bacterium]